MWELLLFLKSIRMNLGLVELQMSMEYTVFDSRTFCTGQDRALQLMYGEAPEIDTINGSSQHLQTAASRLLSLLISLKVQPHMHPKY